MNVIITPSHLEGTVSAPPSKSMAHRYLICAGLAQGESRIRGVSDSADMQATLNLLSGMGVTWKKEGDTVTLTGRHPLAVRQVAPMDCLECGSTLRFFIPICLLSGNQMTLCGSPRLLARPLEVYESLCRQQGFLWEQTPASLTLQGPLSGGEYTLRGDVSSQFVSGLLFALPLCEQASVLHILPPMESRPYVDMTLEALKDFGICIEQADDFTYRIPGGQRYLSRQTNVEGDYSNAAFLEALTALGHAITVTGLDPQSLQGDRVYQDHFKQLSRGFAEISLAQCPDLGPVLMTLAAACHGATFTHTRRLSIKESDRGAAMAVELAKCGVRVERGEDTITVFPGIKTPEVPLEGHNDHRIVMALAILLTRVGGELRGARAVCKSYPDFFEILQSIGADIKIYETGQE